jgi:hypothetical protein
MKKLIVMALGLGLALGSISFAQDTSTSTKKTKAKKTKAKKTDASTTKM